MLNYLFVGAAVTLVYVAVVTADGIIPVLTAIALIVVVSVRLIAAVYFVLCEVGAVPSVV